MSRIHTFTGDAKKTAADLAKLDKDAEKSGKRIAQISTDKHGDKWVVRAEVKPK